MKRLVPFLGAMTVLLSGAPASAAVLAPGDRQILVALAELANLSSEQADRIWPGFRVLNEPLALFDPGRVTLVCNLPHAPARFSPVLEVPPVLVGHVFARYGTALDVERPHEGMLRLEGRRMSCVPMQYLADDPVVQPRKLVGPLFDSYMARAFARFPSGPIATPARYPATAPENGALAELEGQILAVGLQQADPRQRVNYARYFLAIRAERRAHLEPASIRFEDLLERREGIPRYVETIMRDRARSGTHHPLAGIRWDTESDDRRGLMVRLRLPLDPETNRRSHFAATGTALGLLLDSLGTSAWKKQLTSGVSFTDALSEVSHFSSDQGPALRHLAKQNFNYSHMLAEARDVQRHFPTSFQEFLKSTGNRIAISGLVRVHEAMGSSETPGPGVEWLRLDAPQRPMEVDRHTLLVPRLSEFSYRRGNVYVIVRKSPLMTQSRDLFWPFETVSYFEEEPTRLKISLDGHAWAWHDGSFPFHVGLRIQGDHLVVAATQGSLTAKGKTLQLQLRR